MWGLDAASPAVFLALLAPMLTTATERITAGVAVLLALGFLPVLPAGAPVLMAALAAPLVLFLKGRADAAKGRENTMKGRTKSVPADGNSGKGAGR